MPSYLSYLRQVAVCDADDDNIETWITMNGNHIPIMKGQSKEEAVKNFIAKKQGGEESSGGKKQTFYKNVSGKQIYNKPGISTAKKGHTTVENELLTEKEMKKHGFDPASKGFEKVELGKNEHRYEMGVRREVKKEPQTKEQPRGTKIETAKVRAGDIISFGKEPEKYEVMGFTGKGMGSERFGLKELSTGKESLRNVGHYSEIYKHEPEQEKQETPEEWADKLNKETVENAKRWNAFENANVPEEVRKNALEQIRELNKHYDPIHKAAKTYEEKKAITSEWSDKVAKIREGVIAQGEAASAPAKPSVRKISTKEDLDRLYQTSQSTILGAGGDLQEWIDGINDWMKENDLGQMEDIVTYSGADVNKAYGLQGDNRFPDDLTILSWSNNGITNIGKYSVQRFPMGIRWFDDIIDNSVPESQRAGLIGTKTNPEAEAHVQAMHKFQADTGIAPEEYEAYESVRESGITNMFDVGTVMQLSGLPRDKVMTIMKNYSEARKVYGGDDEE